jgi:hypothetical protein
MKATVLVICPQCGQINDQAMDDGATEGPREWHAACWGQAANSMTNGQIRQAWSDSLIDDPEQRGN